MRLTVITPAFNEALNLAALHARLASTLASLQVDWEWLVIDDHSRDDTFGVLAQLARVDSRVRAIRLARNAGSHVAITCGLHHANGDAAVMMAADLQDPPETLAVMLERWRAGAQIVWAVRRERPGDRTHAGFAAVYYWIMRHVVGMRQMPARGADFFLADRAVIDAFRQFPERNVSVLALLSWLGFRQESIEYDKQPRAAGASGWTIGRKIKLVMDSLTAFSDLPIRIASYGGACLLAFAIAAMLAGLIVPGDRSGFFYLAWVVIGAAGVQMLSVGLVGEYVWRAFDEARRRPLYIVEATIGDATVTRDGARAI